MWPRLRRDGNSWDSNVKFNPHLINDCGAKCSGADETSGVFIKAASEACVYTCIF